jgi:hypothetical protein
MRYGWAFVSDIITGSGGIPGGSDKAIQFASGSTFSGSTNFTFDYTTNIVRLTGTLHADNLIVSSSTIFKSGSTKFGDDPTDTHQFTGSVLVSGSLTATNTITATSASFLDYVQLGTSLSDEVYFNASSKTNIQPATTNDVDLGASSRFWRTGYITTLSSSAISSSVNIKTGEITATSAIINGPISSSGNINGSGLQIAGSGQFGGPVTVTGSVSASIGLQTAGAGQFGNGVTVTGTISSSVGLQTAGTLTVGSNAVIKNGLVVTGTVSASSFVGDGNNITDINGANVNGVGNDWTIQFKNGVGGTLTGSSNLTFSGSTLRVTGSLYITDAIKGGYMIYSSSVSIPNTSYFVGLNSVSSVLTASLLAATNYPQGQTLILKDVGGYAGTNNILIKASGSETIDGASGVSLTANSSSVSIISNGSNGFYIVGIV